MKRQLQELDVEHVHITFNNVHYVSTLLYDVHGHYLQVTVEGQLPIGHLYGLASRSTGDALAHQQEIKKYLFLINYYTQILITLELYQLMILK